MKGILAVNGSKLKFVVGTHDLFKPWTNFEQNDSGQFLSIARAWFCFRVSTMREWLQRRWQAEKVTLIFRTPFCFSWPLVFAKKNQLVLFWPETIFVWMDLPENKSWRKGSFSHPICSVENWQHVLRFRRNVASVPFKANEWTLQLMKLKAL